MSLTMIVTNAGRAALVNAANTGTAPVTIASCGISASAVVPAVGATALPGEIKRIATLSGDVVADDTIHMVVRDEGASVFTLRSFALYLGDGTLFAIYGQAAPILEKSAQSIMLLALDVRFADVAAASLTFGNTNFLNPPATPEQIGVVELATLAEQLAGTDDRRVAAAKTIKDAVFSWLDARFGANNAGIWHPGNDGAGSGLDADLLDGQQGSYYANIPARLGYTPANKAGDTFGGPINAPVFNLTTISNCGFYASGGNPVLGMDLGDYVFFDRPFNTFGFTTGGTVQASITADGFVNAAAGMKAAGNIVWHVGNDGSGSGLDADTLDGFHASSFATANSAQSITGRKTFLAGATGNSSLGTATSGLGEIEVQASGTGAAMIAFHRPGAFAAYLGIEYDNTWRVGGWSMGGNSFRLWHEGNDGSGSGLDADLLDGLQATDFLRRNAEIWITSGEGQRRLFFSTNNTTFFGAGNGFAWRRNDDVNLATLDNGGHFATAGNITANGGSLGVGGSAYFALNGGYPVLNFDNNDFIGYDRNANSFNFIINGVQQGNLAIDGYLNMNGGFRAGGNTVWHGGNDGSGSGLDADLLDGYHATAFDRIVAQNLVQNGGYVVYASGRKEAWGLITVGQDSYGSWTIPAGAGFTSWVHPTFSYTGKAGTGNTGDNTMISSVTTAAIGIYNAEDTNVTVYIRVVGV